MSQPLGGLSQELEQDRAKLERELAEIEMLLRQTASEAERHEARRAQAEERLVALEQSLPEPPEQVVEARAQLLSQTRRSTLMQAQLDVLSGKQRALQRYYDRISATLPALHDAGPGSDAVPSAAGEPGAAGEHRAPAAVVMAAQEGLRREIARQMHDGPAQSIANIALHAQVVQRLFERQPERAGAELTELVRMVQHALEATKDFIFDVRPMVLDDLGLVPTLRRTCAERGRRSETPIRFESVGPDRRLRSELESAVFRIVDDTLSAYLHKGALEVLVRLDWSDGELRAIVRGQPAAARQPVEAVARQAVAAARRDRQMPAALANMIREQESAGEGTGASLPELIWRDIEQRAGAAGISVSRNADGTAIEAIVGPSASAS